MSIISAFKYLFDSSFRINSHRHTRLVLAFETHHTSNVSRCTLTLLSSTTCAARKEGSEVCSNETGGNLYIKKGSKRGGSEVWCYGIWKGIQMDCLCCDCSFDSSMCSPYDRSTYPWVSYLETNVILYLIDDVKYKTHFLMFWFPFVFLILVILAS